MGSSASKAARAAPARKYPKRAPGAPLPTQQTVQRQAPRPRPTHLPRPDASDVAPAKPPKASLFKNDAIEADGSDPTLTSRMLKLGVVQPNPTFSPSSIAGLDPQAAAYSAKRPRTKNETLNVLDARRRLYENEAAERTGGEADKAGREFLSASMLQEILKMRADGMGATAIEKKLQLKAGVVARLGRPGLVEPL